MKLVPQTTAPQVQIANTRGSNYAQNAKALFQKNMAAVEANPSADLSKTSLESPAAAPARVPATPVAEDVQIAPIEASEESSPAPVEAKAPAEEPVSAQFAALARKEKALRARAMQDQAKIKAREEALATREAQIKAQESEYSTKYIPKDRLQQDTLNALADAGLSYEQITELMINQQSANPQYDHKIKSLEAKIEQMRLDSEASKKSFQEQTAEQEKAVLNQIGYDVRKAVKGNPEFESIEKTNSFQDVVDLIESVYKKGIEGDPEYPSGTVLDVYEAAKMVEKEIEEDLYKYATSINKIQKRLSPKQVAQAQAQQTQSSPKEQQLNTLTNNVGTSRKLSSRDRAVLAFKGQLS